MLLRDLGTGLLRRWYFVVVGVLLTACAALLLSSVVPPTYKGTARVVLLPPASLVTPGGNPYLFLGGLDQALSVLSVRLGSGSVQEEIVKGHAGTGYVAEKDLASSGPIMLITSESESPESSLQMLDDVLKVVPQNLVIMQDQLNVPASSRITAMTIVRENEALIDRKSQLRAVLAAVAVGGCITVLVTGLLDRLITSRKGTKRRRRQDTGVQDQPLEDTPPTAEQDGSSRSGFRIGRPVLAGHRASEGPPPLPQVEKKEEFPTMASNK